MHARILGAVAPTAAASVATKLGNEAEDAKRGAEGAGHRASSCAKRMVKGMVLSAVRKREQNCCT
jgi:hypothetical protein